MSSEVKEYTFYWADGRREVFEGYSLREALATNGFNRDAWKEASFVERGYTINYQWTGREWIRKEIQK